MTVKDLCGALTKNTRVTVTKGEIVADFYSDSIGAIDEPVAELEVEKIEIEVTRVSAVRIFIEVKAEQEETDVNDSP